MEFELSRNLPIGHYIPTGSFVHRLDPRTKLLGTLFFFLTVSFARSLAVSLILLVTLLLITRLARLPLRFILRSLLASWPILAFFLLLALLYLGWQNPPGRVYWQWGYLRITRAALQMLALSLTRLLSLLFVVSLPSLTTPLTQLTHGVELLLLPFQRFGVPAVEIALVNTIALRFVPTLAEELERVMKAQASRCGAIGNLSWRRPIQIGQTLLPLMVPLFVNAFRRAEELATAMEARGYFGGQGRTRYIQLHSNWFDKAIVLGLLGFCLAVALAPWPALHTLLPGL